MRTAFTLSMMAAASIVVGCGAADEAGTGHWGGTIDTLPSGRIVVHNPDVPLWQGTWTLEERVRIGSADAAGPALFGRIGGLELGPNGEIYVLDGQANEIRVFAADGSFQRAFGREGEGPGELKGAGGLALDSQGTLWVMNWGNGRYSGFDPATGHVRRETRRFMSFASFPWPGAFERGTRLVDVGLDRAGEPAIIRLDTAFVPSDTLPLPEPSSDDRILFRRGQLLVASMIEPFAPQPAWAPRPRGGIVLGEGAEYRLHRIGFDGDTSLTIELARAPAPVSAAERDSALAAFEERGRSLAGVRPDRRPRVRTTKPAHGALFVDDQDRTWVPAVLPAGAEPQWDVFGADGRYLGQVAIPDSPGFLRPVLRGNRMAVATQVDGVPTVVVYALIGGRPPFSKSPGNARSQGETRTALRSQSVILKRGRRLMAPALPGRDRSPVRPRPGPTSGDPLPYRSGGISAARAIAPTSAAVDPALTSDRTRRSIETEGSPASIFATRDWLDPMRFANTAWESLRSCRLRRRSRASETRTSIIAISTSLRSRKSWTLPTFQPAASSFLRRFLSMEPPQLHGMSAMTLCRY